MNGQEQEDEVFEGASSAEYWMYDSRTGRRFENDPISYEYQSPYACFNNNPIYFADPFGLEGANGDGGGDKPKGEGGGDKPKAGDKPKGKSAGDKPKGKGKWVEKFNPETGKIEGNFEGPNEEPNPNDTPGSNQSPPENKDKNPEPKNPSSTNGSNNSGKKLTIQISQKQQNHNQNNPSVGRTKLSPNSQLGKYSDGLKKTDGRLNTGLGFATGALWAFNKIPNTTKSKAIYESIKKLGLKKTGMKPGAIYQGSKKIAKAGKKILSKLGPVGGVVSGGVIVFEVFTDTWDTHTIVNGALLVTGGVVTGVAAVAATAAAPFILTGIVVYGIADFFFDVGDKIDAKVGRETWNKK